MTITKNERGTWETYLYLGKDENGRKVKKHLTAKTKAELQDLIDTMTRTLDINNVSAMDMTVRECVDGYIERRKNGNYSPKTIREYIQYRNKVFPELWNIKIKNLTDKVLQNAIDRASVGHSPKSVKNWWGLYKASIGLFNKHFAPRVYLPRETRSRFEMPDSKALTALFNAIEGKTIEIPVLLACCCGLRRGEISALDLSHDVDYERCTIHINKDMVQSENGEWVIKPHPKTEAGNRVVPCPKALIEKLSAWKADQKPMPNGNTITNAWKRLRKKYGIDCTFHGLRHYYCSVMESLGVPWTYQKERMGHSTDYMLTRYQEYLREKEVEVDESLQRHFDDLLQKK